MSLSVCFKSGVVSHNHVRNEITVLLEKKVKQELGNLKEGHVNSLVIQNHNWCYDFLSIFIILICF